MKKALIILLAALLISTAACSYEYTPKISLPEPTPEPTPEPYDPGKLTLGVYGAPELTAYGFLKTAEELGYKAERLDGMTVEEVLLWGRENGGLLLYGAGGADRAAINETAAYGCAVVTGFFPTAAPKGAKANIEFKEYDAGTAAANIMAGRLSGKEGVVLVCRSSDSEAEAAAEAAFRRRWARVGSSKIALSATEYTGEGEHAASAAAGMLERAENVVGIFACSGECAAALAQASAEIAVKKENTAGEEGSDEESSSYEKPFIMSAAADEAAVSAVMTGELYAAYVQPYYEAGAEAARVMDAALSQGSYYEPSGLEGRLIYQADAEEYYSLLTDMRAFIADR